MNYLSLIYKLYPPKSSSSIIENDITKTLDPIMTLIKLSILSFKPMNTKISILNHNIYINPPTYIQGIIRNYYGDTKEDLHYLLLPIYTICISYIYNVKEDISREGIGIPILKFPIIPNFILLLKLAKNGLLLLKQTYANYISIKHSIDIIIYVIDNALALNIVDYSSIINGYDVNRYNYIWNAAELETIIALFALCGTEPDKKQYYISSIESLVIPIENGIALRL